MVAFLMDNAIGITCLLVLAVLFWDDHFKRATPQDVLRAPLRRTRE